VAKKAIETVIATAGQVMRHGSLGMLFGVLEDAIKESSSVVETGKIGAIREETERQEFAARMAESQARVAQELAIARRIETAHEVEMEEQYEYFADGHLGLKTDGSTVTAGAGGSGRRVSKRIFRFKGGFLGNSEQSSTPTDSKTPRRGA
jgi:uncharacterized protein YaaQ